MDALQEVVDKYRMELFPLVDDTGRMAVLSGSETKNFNISMPDYEDIGGTLYERGQKMVSRVLKYDYTILVYDLNQKQAFGRQTPQGTVFAVGHLYEVTLSPVIIYEHFVFLDEVNDKPFVAANTLVINTVDHYLQESIGNILDGLYGQVEAAVATILIHRATNPNREDNDGSS